MNVGQDDGCALQPTPAGMSGTRPIDRGQALRE